MDWEWISAQVRKYGCTLSGGFRVAGWLEQFESNPDLQELNVFFDSWYPVTTRSTHP